MEGLAFPSVDFTTGTTRLHGPCCCLLNNNSCSTSKMLPARGVGHGLWTSNSLQPQTTVPAVCPLIHHHPATQTIPDCGQPIKALALWELWKARPGLPGISQPGQLTYAVGAVACSTAAATMGCVVVQLIGVMVLSGYAIAFSHA